MAFLAAAAPFLQYAGAAIGLAGNLKQGSAAAATGEATAQQFQYRAGQTRASSQRAAIEERRQAQLAVSRGRAIAASSGAGASDPTVTKVLGDLSASGEYAALTRMYEGEDSAAGMEAAAGVQRRQGSAARVGSYAKAASTVLDQGVSLWDKYGK